MQVFKEALTLLPGGVNSPVRAFKSVGGQPIIFDHVSGPYCFDVDGNKVSHACRHPFLVLRYLCLTNTRTVVGGLLRGVSQQCEYCGTLVIWMPVCKLSGCC